MKMRRRVSHIDRHFHPCVLSLQRCPLSLSLTHLFKLSLHLLSFSILQRPSPSISPLLHGTSAVPLPSPISLSSENRRPPDDCYCSGDLHGVHVVFTAAAASSRPAFQSCPALQSCPTVLRAGTVCLHWWLAAVRYV